MKILEAVKERKSHTDVIVFHIANGGGRSSPQEGRRLRELGVKPGMPDLGFIVPPKGKIYFLEVKPDKGGTLSDAQTGTHAQIRRAGANVETCRGAAHGIAILEAWRIISKTF
jgi:hypothetical protein